MSYISAFDPSEDKKRNLASKILYISESVIETNYTFTCF